MCRHCKSLANPRPPSTFQTLASLAVPASVIGLGIFTGFYFSPIVPALGLGALATTILFRAGRMKGKQLTETEKKLIYEDEFISRAREFFFSNKMIQAQALSKAIQIATISYEPDSPLKADSEKLVLLHNLLRDQFKQVFTKAEVQVISDFSLIIKLKGSNSELEPVLFMGHLDVVPIGDEGAWKYPPFSGSIAEGFVWGRGALDCKATVIALLATLEYIIQSGELPNRDIYLAFGHDEEIGGHNGAQSISKYFESNKIRFASIIDEGTGLITQAIPGLKEPLGMIGVCEKGFIDVEANVTLDTKLAGHASMPPLKNAIAMLGVAMDRINRFRAPLYLAGTVRDMFEIAAPHLPFIQRILFANLWLFKSFVAKTLAGKPGTASMLQTTSAVTMFNAGTKSNVLAKSATAVINHRIHPLDSVDGVLAYDRHVIANDEVTVKPRGSGLPASPVSSHESVPFKTIVKAIASIDTKCVVAPAMMMGNTDTRWYWNVSSNIFRFMPFRLAINEISMIHGDNERFEINNLAEMSTFYYSFIKLME